MTDWGPFAINGKRAIVTGGAMGIGKGIVKRFLEGGAKVFTIDIAVDQLNKTVSEFQKIGDVVGFEADLQDEKAPEKIVNETVKILGGIDVLVNNAGIYPMVPMMEISPDLFDKVYRVNLKSLAFLSREAAKQMIKQGNGGKIVNIASIDSVHPSNVGLAAYDSSKGGVLMFTKSFALEVAPYGIQVNTIAPGGIATEGASLPSIAPEKAKELMESFIRMIPLGRIGMPDDIAKATVFLSSSAADYMTGSFIVVDGGRLLR